MVGRMSNLRIVVAGAGSIGCYVGGLLAAAGRQVSLLARERVVGELEQHGLHLSDMEGLAIDLPASTLGASSDPALLATADIVLVTVKSTATVEMARLIAGHAPTQAIVVSLQNGVSNADVLRQHAGGRRVLAGMVPFNVIHSAGGRFHRGTSGELVIEAGAPDVLDAMRVANVPVQSSGDMPAVLWGKLVLNLNNALNALSGLTLHEQLGQRRWRTVLAGQQHEALALLKLAGIKPRSIGPLPTALLPHLLRLPTPLFRLLARSAVRIDKRARSSMWEDLERRRPTEIDQLQGAVVALAGRLGRSAPLNQRVASLVKQAEAAASGSPRLSPDALQ